MRLRMLLGGVALVFSLVGCGSSDPSDDSDADADSDSDTDDRPCSIRDIDEDGEPAMGCGGLDCDDRDATVHPGAADDVDGTDQNCDEVDGVDADGDRRAAVDSGGEDCDDADPYAYPGAPEGWTEEIIQENETVDWVALASGPAGLHATYCVGTCRFHYATDVTGAWSVEAVDGEDSRAGEYSSIALDAAGAPHVSYYATGGSRYATKTDADWEIQSIPGTERGPTHTSIALGDGGTAHFSYQVWKEGLHYARFDGSGWESEVVDLDDAPGFTSAIALAAGDVPIVAYYGYGEPELGTLRLATRDVGGWRIEAVEAAVGNPPSDPSIVVDEAGAMHVLYVDEDHEADWNAEVHYATNESGDWEIETLEQGATASGQRAMAVDSTGVLRAVFCVHTTSPRQELRLGTRADGVWTFDVVSEAERCVSEALAIDSAGAPAIVYAELHYIWDPGYMPFEAYGPGGLVPNGSARVVRPTPPDGIDQDCDGKDG